MDYGNKAVHRVEIDLHRILMMQTEFAIRRVQE